MRTDVYFLRDLRCLNNGEIAHPFPPDPSARPHTIPEPEHPRAFANQWTQPGQKKAPASAGALRFYFISTHAPQEITNSKSAIFEDLPVTGQKLYLHGFYTSALGREKKFTVTEVAKL